MKNIEHLEFSDLAYHQPIPQAQEAAAAVDTFAFPSHEIMQRLLAIFAGKPQRLPEKYLTRDQAMNSQDENQYIADFVNSVLQETFVKETYGNHNELIQVKEQIAIISNNPLVDGKARIPEDLFNDLAQREENLALYIQKTFGAEGLRHFLGLVIGFDEHGRKGVYHFTINEHLDRLGYQRSKKGSYDPAIKWKALRIIQLFSSLELTISSRKGNKEKISNIKLFSLDRYDLERKIDSGEFIHMKFLLRANEDWYGKAFQQTDNRSQQYTQLLKKIAAENHREHPLVIYLTPQLAIRWRINKFQPLSLRVSTIMEMCDLDHSHTCKNRMRDLRDLESELTYMVEMGYLGQWSNKDGGLPSDNCHSFNCVLQLAPPNWLCNSMRKSIQGKGASSTITVEGLQWIQQQTDLSQNKMAEILGVTRQHMSRIFLGRCRISSKLSQKITEAFRDLLEKCQLNPALLDPKPCPLRCQTLPS